MRNSSLPLVRSVLQSLLLSVLSLPFAATAQAVNPAGRPCRIATLQSQVRAGQTYAHLLGNGLSVLLEPLPSGWILRVLPAQGARGEHDYAELATPPYRSVNPLLLSTDFSFRSQDVLAWNPRRFRFAPDAATFHQLLLLYDLEFGAPSGEERKRTESRLGSILATAPAGEFDIIDGRLVPGTANQTTAASMVASHLNATAHTIEQPADGKADPLGQVTWLEFRIRLELPSSFVADRSVSVQRGACL